MAWSGVQVLVQFEDFQTTYANPLLEKYRHQYRMFNDDIQGTGTVALSAMLGCVLEDSRRLNRLFPLVLNTILGNARRRPERCGRWARTSVRFRSKGLW